MNPSWGLTVAVLATDIPFHGYRKPVAVKLLVNFSKLKDEK